jgi:hypothetical protein
MTTSAAYEQWLRANQDKRGTPDYATVLQAFEVALRREAGAAAPAPTAPEQRTGFGAALGRGFESLIGTTTTGVQAATGDANQAAELALKRAAASPYAAQVSWDKVKEVYGTQGALAAAFEVARQAPLAIAEQLPQLGASLGATAAGAKLGALTSPVTGPVGPIVGGGLGFLASTMPSIFGSNIERQAAEQQQAGKPIDIDVGAAAGAAALQTGLEAAGTFIPLGRTVAGKLFGPQVEALLKQGKEKAAEALARESLGKMVAKGAAVGVAAEVPTEVVQQALERAQAGLPVLSDDALTEYAQAAYQTTLVGAPLGTAGRAMSRSEARTAQAEAAAAQEAEQRKAAREAAEAEKKSPEYLLKLDTDYQAAVKRMQELQAAVKDKPGKDALPDERVEYQQRVEELKAFTNETMRPLTAEYTPRKAEIAQLKERQRVEGMTPEEYAEYSYQEAVKRQPRTALVAEKPEELSADFGDITAPVVTRPRVEPTAAYAQSRIALANSQQDADRLDPKDRAPVYAEYLLGSIPTARRLVQANEQLPDLGKRESATILSLVKEGLKKYDMQQAAKQQGSPIAQLEAEERAALEETERAEAERLAETEERRKLGPEITSLQRMAARRLPESVKEAPYLDTVLERIARATPPEAQPSAAIGQTQQLLLGEDVTYTAEEPKAPAEPRRVKGTGEFRLYSPPSEEVEGRPPVEKPLTAKDLETRLASSLAREDLPQDIYELLRRVERTLPAQDTQVGREEQKLKPLRFETPSGKTIYPETQVAPKSYYGLVDALLKQVEATQPGEGAPRRITSTSYARAFTAEPTTAAEEDLTLAEARQQRFADNLRKGMSRGDAARDAYAYARERAERAAKKGAKPETAERLGAEYEAEVRAGQAVPKGTALEFGAPVPGRGKSAIGPDTLRGPSAATPEFDLDVPQELRLALTAFEQGRADTEAQLPLFPEGAEKGFILETPEAFKKFLEGKDRPRTMLQREQARFDKARKSLKELKEEIARKEKELKAIQAAKDTLVAARAIVKADKELTALVKKGETLQITTPLSISYIPNAKPALTQAAIDKMDVDERIRRIEEVRGARARVINSANVSAEDKVQLLEVAQVYATELQAAEAERGALLAKTDYLIRAVAVEKALNDIAQLSGRPGMDARIEALQEQLGKARESLGTAGITVSRADAAAAAQSAKAQREREAVKRGLAETERTKRYVAQQQALERMQAAPGGRAVEGAGIPGSTRFAPTQELGAVVYPALTEAQRLSREQPQPRITLVEQKQLLGDPQKVLSGLQSRVSTLAEKLRNKTDAVRQMKLKEIKERKPYDELQAKYKAAKSAEARAAIEPDLQAAERAYNLARNEVMQSVVVWKGYDKDITELATAVRKRDAVADLISSGAFKGAQPQPKRRIGAAEKAAADAAERAASAREAATRAGAPETTGEALTRTEAAEARKAEKTVYQGKGVGVEERASVEEARLLREARQRQARGEELTPLEQFLIEQDNRSRTKETVARRKKEERLAEIRAKDEAGESLTPAERKLLDEADREAEAPAEEDTVSLEALREAETAQKVEGEETPEAADEDARPLDEIFRSRGPTATPSTTGTVRTELKKTFPDLGRVQIYDSVDALVAANPQYKGKIPADARGFVDSAGNKAFLIAENIPQGQALSVLLHEVGAHVGLKSMLGDAQYSALVNAVKSWEKKTDGSTEARVAQAARARVEAAETPAGQVNDELLAYAIEEAVNAGVKPTETKGVLGQWLGRVAQLFRRALEKFGLPPKTLDAQGIVDMAFGAAKMEMRGQAAPAAEARTEPGEILFSRNLPTAARVANQLVGKEKGVIDKIRDNFLGIGGRAQFIDKYFPTEEALKRAGADPTKAMQAMYYLRMVDQQMHFTSQAITNGVPERREIIRPDGTKEYLIEAKPGANLKQAFDILKRKDVVKEAGSADASNKLATLYMAAIRGERVGYNTLNFGRVWAQGEIKRIENELKSTKLSAEQRTVLTKRMNSLESRLDSMPTPEDFKAAKAEIDANPVLRDAFSEVRDIYNQYNRDLINFNVQTGALSKEQANELLQENDYIPYYRIRDGVAELMIGKETPIRIGNLKDSPHLQELVGGDEPIMDFITSSIQNTSMLIDMATHNLAMKNLMFEFKDLGLATVGKVKGGNAPAGAVTFKLDGVEHFGVVDTEALGISSDLLVKGLAGIPTMFPAFVRVMGMPARFLRRMIVASPVYMARMLFRDSTQAAIASGSNTVPILSALKQIGKAGVLERRGITGGQVFTGMPEDMSRMIKAMQAGKLSVTNGLAYLEGKAAQVDALTRRAQYEDYLKQGLSEMEATYRALESMNFSRRGLSPSLHMASTLIPFFNAQIQGLDVLYRSFTGQMPMNERLGVRKKLIARGMMLFGLSIAYAMAMQDDEAYKNAKPEEKYGNWFVSLPGVEQPIRLPIPFELGYIFKALPEAIVNTLSNEEGGEEALKALKHIVQQMIPGGSSYMIPAAVKPLLEVGFGVSAYTGRDIESAREQAIEPGYRARESTTELAKTVGEMTGFSPIKLEFLISGYTGQMGMALISALSAPFAGTGEGPAPATKRPSDLPLVGTLFQPKDASGIIDLVYERMNKVRQVQETYKRMLAENKPEQAKRYAEEKADELSLASVAGAFREQMGQITEFERQVRASTLTPDRKRAELDRARQAKIRLAQAVQGLSGRTAPQAARP